MTQTARNLVMDLEDTRCQLKYLLRDRDGKYPALFDTILADAGISRSVSEAAQGAGDIATNIAGVASAARATNAGVGQSQQSAQELARMSEELRQTVAQFTA